MVLHKKLTVILIAIIFIAGSSYANSSINFVVITDIHLNTKQKYIMRIDPTGYNSKNDMDSKTLSQLSLKIKQNIGIGKLISTPKFVLYLGDMVGHKRPVDGEKFVKNNELKVFLSLQNTFPNIPIINIFGNNDSFEKDYGLFTFQGRSPYSIAEQFGFKNGFLSTGKVCNIEKMSVFPCLLTQNKKHGYFSIKLQDKLLLIGLNTVMLSTKINVNSKQVTNQMNYLKKELELAKTQGMSVLIAMHIPVGNNIYNGDAFWKPSYQKTFLKIIRNYHNYIKGLLVAHTHVEEFKIIKIIDAQDIGEYFTAGLSTSHGNSPSIKVFKMVKNTHSWTIGNYITYQMHRKNGKITLSKYYDFVKTYCKTNPISQDINSCLDKIKFKDLASRYTVNNNNDKYYKTASPKSFYINQ